MECPAAPLGCLKYFKQPRISGKQTGMTAGAADKNPCLIGSFQNRILWVVKQSVPQDGQLQNKSKPSCINELAVQARLLASIIQK